MAAKPYRPAAIRSGAGGRTSNVRPEGAAREASRDERARERHGVRRIGTVKCAVGQDSRLGRGRGARHRRVAKFIGPERAAVVHKHATTQLCRKRFEAGGGIASGAGKWQGSMDREQLMGLGYIVER